MKYTDEELIAYLEGDLNPGKRNEIQNWITNSNGAKERIDQLEWLLHTMESSPDYSPANEIKLDFELTKNTETLRISKMTFWIQIAAAVMLLTIGYVGGKATFEEPVSMSQIQNLEREVQSLTQLVMMNTLKEHSASERIRVVGMIENSRAGYSEELIHTLINTMNTDDSPNVRYAAIQALRGYAQEDVVRQQLVRSLQHQKDPLVQIAMIGLLVEVDEKSVIAPLKKILEDKLSNQEVKQQARVALEILI